MTTEIVIGPRKIEELYDWLKIQLLNESRNKEVVITGETKIWEVIDSLSMLVVLMELENDFFNDSVLPQEVADVLMQNIGTVNDFVNHVTGYANGEIEV
jgi:acyl carrier protein